MKPKSIVAPLILIGLGVLFLMRNVWPDTPMFMLFAKNWPFLLIGWGAVRLAEILIWASRSRPLPVQGISGGEWMGVVFLSLIGSGMFWGERVASSFPTSRIAVRGLEMFGETHDFPVSANKQVGRTPKIVLDLGRGNARITGKDTDQIEITGRKSVRAYERSEADAANRATPLEIVTVGDQVIIRTNQEHVDSARRLSAELEITVPRGSSFEGRGRYGDFELNGLDGHVEINSSNAGVRAQNLGNGMRVELRASDVIRVSNIKGNLDIKSNRGQDLELDSIEGATTVNGEFSGEISFRNLAKPLRFDSSRTELRVEKTMGMVRLALGSLTAESIQGPFRLKTKSRDVQLRDFTQSVEIELERGDIELRPAKGLLSKIEARTDNGNVEMVLPTGAKIDLKARAERGEITNDFGAPFQMEEVDKGATLRGSTGGPTVSLLVGRGSINVRKSDGGLIGSVPAPDGLAPPAPPKAPRLPAVPSPQEQ